MRPRTRITDYPDAWSAHVPVLTGPAKLDVAGHRTTVDLTPTVLRRVCFPLLWKLVDAAAPDTPGELPTSPGPAAPAPPRPRRLIALAGIPGSGKSTFAAVLARVARHLLPHHGFPADSFLVVGMDGWHYPNAELDRRTTRGAAGRAVPLRQRKGSPESFDVPALAAALRRLQAGRDAVTLPAYDRRRHDPVPDTLTVTPHTRFVLVEGNYLLATAPPWHEVSSRVHPRLLVECDPALVRDRLIARHVRGGTSPDDAALRFDANDRLNIETVRSTAGNADMVIRLEPEPGLWTV